MGANELEPDLDGQPGKAVVEERPQAVGRASAARASSRLPSWSAIRALTTCGSALVE
jgi:hypothetical protein